MESSRFDDLARSFAGASTRRRFLTGLAGALGGVMAARPANAACGPDMVERRGMGCICRATGRPPDSATGACPCPAGTVRCGNACVDPNRDKSNCGACGVTCDVGPNVAKVACRDGVCRLATCAAGYADCDGDPANGCETALGTVANCGACGGACVAIDACHVASCDSATGQCVQSVQVGLACDDGDACTENDVCRPDGACHGTPIVCPDADCTRGVCVDGACLAEPKPDGIACDDGNRCTRTDTCQAGACVGSDPVVCAALDQCHDAGVCDPATGVCTDPAKADGTSCDDGDACTRIDTCQGGTCVGSNPVVCTALDQCHHAGVCDPGTGQCSHPAKPDGTTCDDGDACTQIDTCQSGVCVGSEPVACLPLDACHLAGVCDPATGLCSDPPQPDGAPCSDNDACTQTDTCQSGVCTPGTDVVCAPPDQCHQDGVCNQTTGQCEYAAKIDGTSCDDGNACTRTDTCQAGFCVGSNPVVCTALDQCHAVGTCDPATGLCGSPAKANGAACDDGDACTETDTCQDGVCVGGDPVVCPVPDQCNVAGTCNPATGVCSNPAQPDGTICNADNNACTIDTCQTGVCTAGAPKNCLTDPELNDQCNIGVCNPVTGLCERQPKTNGAGCDDGNACTVNDFCQNGVCTPGSAVTCAPLDQCHVAGTCDPETGQCSHPAKPNGTSCSDTNACTSSATCQAGICTPATSVVCTPLDQCHVAGSCNPATGLCSNPPKANGSACNDGNACTQSDTCQNGACVGSNPVVCAAQSQCHDVGVCNPATGICSIPPKPNNTPCNDGNACTQTDTCQGGTCVGGNPVVCTAQSQCHDVGVCNPATGICTNPPSANTRPCNDGNACTQTDRCNGAGACVGSNPVVCAALDECHQAGTCNPSTGVCSNPPASAGTPCGSPASCSGGVQHAQDTCNSGGVCVSGANTSCGNYVCGATSCRATCSNDSHCVPGAFCNASGQCQADGGHGASCNDGAECLSGNCCSGACCAGICCPDGICSANKPGGVCVCVPHCAPPKVCGEDDGCGNPCACPSGRVCCGSGGSGSPSGCCAGPCCGSVCCEFSNSICCGSSSSRVCFTGGTTCPVG